MKLSIRLFVAAALLALTAQAETHARGFGGARAGGAVGPRGGAAVGRSVGGVGVGPYGGVSAGGARGGTYVGPGGTTVQRGSVGGISQGPLGGVRAGGAQGTRVTTPGGRTFTTGSAGSAGVGPYGGVYSRGLGGTAVSGPLGSAAVGHRGGVAVGPYGGVAAGGRTVAVGHGTRYYSPTVLRTQGAYVRGGFRYNCFTPTWYRTHRAAWVAPRWAGPGIWAPPAWSSVALYCGVAAAPILYDYGSNVVIENNYVYVNGEQTVPADQYAQQAAQLAGQGRQADPAADQAWQPLGVFGLVQGEENTAQRIFQLAVDKGGVVRGNYYDAVADTTLPVYGSLDPQTQRVAWSIGEKRDIVFEAGLNNLTQNEAPVLVYFGGDRTDQMFLVRLEEPAGGQ